MRTDREHPDLPALELIRDPDAAATLLKPPRPALLAALREPDSASALARRLGLPRQRVSHHLRELERTGFVELLEKRRRGNFTERILRASARRYLICPEVLGELGTFGAEDLREPHAWTSLAAMSAQTLSELATLRQLIAADPPTLTAPNRLRFASAEALDAFTRELTEQLGRLVRKYHDETGMPYRFVLGAYPASPETVVRESVPLSADLGPLDLPALDRPGADWAADEEKSAEELFRELEEEIERIPPSPQSREWVRSWAPKLGKALSRTIGEPELPETPAGEETLVEDDLLDELRTVADKMLKSLSPRQELVLRMRLGIGEHAENPVKQVANSFNVSRTRIYQIQAKALRQLWKIHPVEVRQFLRLLRQLPET